MNGVIFLVRTIIWFIYFWIYLICMIPTMFKVRKLSQMGEISQHDNIVSTVVNNWARRLLKLAGVNITVKNKENIPSGPVVYIANHQGYFDIPLMLTQMAKPSPILSKIQIKKLPFVRDWMKELHCIFIDRDDPRQSMECLKEAQNLLQQGYSVVIFPEGTRNKGGDLKEFKAGAIRVATKAKVPIIPVCIDGSHTIMEKNNMWIHPGNVTMTVLPPVLTASLSKEEIRELPDKLREMLSVGLGNKLQNSECKM